MNKLQYCNCMPIRGDFMDISQGEYVTFNYKIKKTIYDKECAPYIDDFKHRHKDAKSALLETMRRKKGRDKKRQAELLYSNMMLLLPVIQKMIDEGRLIMRGEK